MMRTKLLKIVTLLLIVCAVVSCRRSPPPKPADLAVPTTNAEPAIIANDDLHLLVNNLRHFESAKYFWANDNNQPTGAVPQMADLTNYFRNGSPPQSPIGGKIIINPVGTPAGLSLTLNDFDRLYENQKSRTNKCLLSPRGVTQHDL